MAGWVALGGASFISLSIAGWVIYPALLSTPFTTAYAVLVRQALDVRLVVRRALQYALARYSVMVLASVPLVALIVTTYRRRDQSIATVATDPDQLALFVAALAGTAAVFGRGRLLAHIDRRFFREQYDARRILDDLVVRCRVARDRAELAAVVRTEIDRALHLDTARVLFLETERRVFAAPDADVPPIPADAVIVAETAAARPALAIDLDVPSGAAQRLPAPELHWAIDAGVRLLLPVRDAAGRLVALLALGEKRSELPFSPEDLVLLERVGAAVAMATAFLAPEPATRHNPLADVAERRAAECVGCGAVQPPERADCVRCGSATVESVLPQVVGGKFLVDERVGAGGMGVVYRGMDVELGRLVAIKTLPALTPRDALPLRREARAMAAVSHPNLALIFGAESWQGRPMLIVEYLAGGTLADRLANGPIPPDQVIVLGRALASVLGAVHDAGILHRDVKPSNIGFASDGRPKLLDFGLAHLLDAIAASHGGSRMPDGDAPTTLGIADGAFSRSSASVVRGTPLYMSPEALAGEPPDASFDLWSLAVLLFEAASGRHPFVDRTDPHVRPRRAAAPALRTLVADAPPALDAYFRAALAERRADRPHSAAEVERLLAAAR